MSDQTNRQTNYPPGPYGGPVPIPTARPLSEMRIIHVRGLTAALETALANIRHGHQYGTISETSLADVIDLERRASQLARDTAHMTYKGDR